MTDTNAHYENAPITEAVIDIRVTALPTTNPLDLKKIALNNPSFSVMDLNQGTFQIKLGQSDKEAVIASTTPVGFHFKSSDEKYVHQLKIDGFTSSRIAPYKDWDDLKKSAMTMWPQYKSIVNPQKITRLAVRYINRIDLPLPVSDFEDYFRTFAKISPDLPQELSGFVMQLVLPLNDIGATAIINEAIIPPTNPGTAAFVLDIDIFSEVNFTDDSEVWNTLDKLRSAKNKVFEASITDKVRELIK